jgi:hypothetical protein
MASRPEYVACSVKVFRANADVLVNVKLPKQLYEDTKLQGVIGIQPVSDTNKTSAKATLKELLFTGEIVKIMCSYKINEKYKRQAIYCDIDKASRAEGELIGMKIKIPVSTGTPNEVVVRGARIPRHVTYL